MMEGWRKGRVDNYNSEATRTRSRSKKPPNVSWQQTVPSWEKKFCTSIGTIPWWKIIEMKSCMHLYDNVLQWNDSAAEEAFHNAKARFFANMRGLQCDIRVPDPDMYIDEINWDSKNDPELELDLDCDPLVPNEDEKGESVVIFDNSFVSDQGFSGTGWGDTEQEGLKKVANSSTDNNDNLWDQSVGQNGGPVKGDNGWGDFGNYTGCWNEVSNGGAAVAYGWNSSASGGWGNGWNNSNNNGWGYGWNNSYSWGWNGYGNDSYGAHDQATGQYPPQYRAPSFRGGQGQNWKNGNGRRRGNFVSKQARDTTQVS